MTHPITPPPELVQQWVDDHFGVYVAANGFHKDLATSAAQWGADQELEACSALIEQKGFLPSSLLRAARRPKPPSLKEQALDVLHLSFDRGYLKEEAADTIRRALEQLND